MRLAPEFIRTFFVHKMNRVFREEYYAQQILNNNNNNSDILVTKA